MNEPESELETRGIALLERIADRLSVIKMARGLPAHVDHEIAEPLAKSKRELSEILNAVTAAGL